MKYIKKSKKKEKRSMYPIYTQPSKLDPIATKASKVKKNDLSRVC
jgi:hypothetical protein